MIAPKRAAQNPWTTKPFTSFAVSRRPGPRRARPRGPRRSRGQYAILGVRALGRAMLALCGAASFLSAALLFLVQPMFARAVLPRLGGAPAVWNTAMVCYQATLLLG